MNLNLVTNCADRVAVRNVLVSVADKRGLDAFIPRLVECCPGVKIFSTGGSFASIEKILGERARGTLVSVSDYTGQPEMQGGLVKTLDFKIYLGLLSETDNPAHQADLARTGAVAFDMVVVNLYPFAEAVAANNAAVESARTHIDIGGPCMVRAAAKNFLRVASVTDPSDYGGIADELATNNGTLGFATRFGLMQKAFRHTAHYDAAIAAHFGALDAASARAAYSMLAPPKGL